MDMVDTLGFIFMLSTMELGRVRAVFGVHLSESNEELLGILHRES